MIGSEVTVPRNRRRERGFLRAFKNAPTDTAPPELVRVQPTVAGGSDGLAQLLERRSDLDGIFAFNDSMAVGAMRAAQSAGYRVPDDLAIVGCNDIEMSGLVSPRLTTVRLDRRRLSAEAIRILNSLIEAPETTLPRWVLPRGTRGARVDMIPSLGRRPNPAQAGARTKRPPRGRWTGVAAPPAALGRTRMWPSARRVKLTKHTDLQRRFVLRWRCRSTPSSRPPYHMKGSSTSFS